MSFFGKGKIDIIYMHKTGVDLTAVEATEADVLIGKKFIDKTGVLKTGTLEETFNPAIAESYEELNSKLTEENIGKVYKFTGTNDIKVGDKLSAICFDTTKEPDLTALRQADLGTFIKWGEHKIEYEGQEFTFNFGVSYYAWEEDEGLTVMWVENPEEVNLENVKLRDIEIYRKNRDLTLYNPNRKHGWLVDRIELKDSPIAVEVKGQEIWGDYIKPSMYKKDKLYTIAEVNNKITPVKVGSPYPDRLYFDTEVTPDLAELVYDDNGKAVLMCNDYVSLCAYDMSVVTGGQINAYYIVYENYSTKVVIYSTEAFEYNGVTANAGWNIDYRVWGGGIIKEINQQEVWGDYISAAPIVNRNPVGAIELHALQKIYSEATAENVLVGKEFYNAEGDVVTGTYELPTFIEKTVTENGVYTASGDGVDGYRAVTVNIAKDNLPSGIRHEYFIQEGATEYSLFVLPIQIEGEVVSATNIDNGGNLEVTLNE